MLHKKENKQFSSRIPLTTDTPYSEAYGWTHKHLSYPEFRIVTLKGNIDFAFLECSLVEDVRPAATRSLSTAQLDLNNVAGWEIPATWGSCAVVVIGDPGSTIDLHEYRRGSLESRNFK